MATERSGGNTGLAFVVGGLLVLVLVILAVMLMGGGDLFGGGEKRVDVNINAPSLPVGGEAK